MERAGIISPPVRQARTEWTSFGSPGRFLWVFMFLEPVGRWLGQRLPELLGLRDVRGPVSTRLCRHEVPIPAVSQRNFSFLSADKPLRTASPLFLRTMVSRIRICLASFLPITVTSQVTVSPINSG